MCDLESVRPTTFTALLGCHTRSAIRCAVAAGRLARPFHGVYVGSELAGRTAVRVLAAQLSIGRELPPAFHTAAALQGFDVLDDGRIHLIGPEQFDHTPQPGLVVHSTARTPPLTTTGGLVVTTPERAVIDLARTHSGMDALAVVDAALRTGRVSPDSLTAELLRHEGLRGVVDARWAVANGNGLAESPQESRLRWIALAAGLPCPRLQIQVRTPDGDYRLDMGYDDIKVGIEYDGDGHADRNLLRYDRTRHNALGEKGWTMRYFTDWDIYRTPQATADRLARHRGVTARRLPARTVFPRDQGDMAAS